MKKSKGAHAHSGDSDPTDDGSDSGTADDGNVASDNSPVAIRPSTGHASALETDIDTTLQVATTQAKPATGTHPMPMSIAQIFTKGKSNETSKRKAEARRATANQWKKVRTEAEDFEAVSWTPRRSTRIHNIEVVKTSAVRNLAATLKKAAQHPEENNDDDDDAYENSEPDAKRVAAKTAQRKKKSPKPKVKDKKKSSGKKKKTPTEEGFKSRDAASTDTKPKGKKLASVSEPEPTPDPSPAKKSKGRPSPVVHDDKEKTVISSMVAELTATVNAMKSETMNAMKAAVDASIASRMEPFEKRQAALEEKAAKENRRQQLQSDNTVLKSEDNVAAPGQSAVTTTRTTRSMNKKKENSPQSPTPPSPKSEAPSAVRSDRDAIDELRRLLQRIEQQQKALQEMSPANVIPTTPPPVLGLAQPPPLGLHRPIERPAPLPEAPEGERWVQQQERVDDITGSWATTMTGRQQIQGTGRARTARARYPLAVYPSVPSTAWGPLSAEAPMDLITECKRS
jgi:hypothetical protein